MPVTIDDMRRDADPLVSADPPKRVHRRANPGFTHNPRRKLTASPSLFGLDERDELVRKAQEYAGVQDTAALGREALTALVQREAARRLAEIGGSVPDFPDVPRRKARRK
jgi:hypothetical protein